MTTTAAGYSVIDTTDNSVLVSVPKLPKRVDVPNVLRIDFNKVGETSADGRFVLVERLSVDQPHALSVQGATLESYNGTAVVEDPQWQDVPLLGAQEQVIQGIKADAGELILAVYPFFKQENAKSRALELLKGRIVSGAWSANEQLEVDAIQNGQNWIKQIQDHSNTLEAEVVAITSVTTLATWVPHSWPGVPA